MYFETHLVYHNNMTSEDRIGLERFNIFKLYALSRNTPNVADPTTTNAEPTTGVIIWILQQ